MMRAVAAFEFRQQLRSHVFWIVSVVSLLMVLGSVTVEELRVGLRDGGARNGAEAVVETHLLWSLFFMFTTAALVGDAVLRDTITGFAPLVQATPVRRRDVVLGRFLGAFAAVLVCFLTVPLGLLLGSAAPWLSPASVVSTPWTAYPFALFVMAVPNLLLSATIGFGLATATRSMTGALLGAVTLLIVYGLGSTPGGGAVAALIEPFGFAAYREAVAGWSAVWRDASVPPVAGALLLNRVLWLGIGLSMLAVAQARFGWRPSAYPPVRSDDAEPDTAEFPPPPVLPSFGAATVRGQLITRTRLEVGRVVFTPACAVLMLLAAANAGAALWSASDPQRGAATPATLIPALIGAFQLVPVVIALFWAGELMWADREHGMQAIVAAAPLADAAFVLPKLLALALVFAALAFATAAVALSVQAVRGIGPIEPSTYATAYALPACFDWTLFAALAMFLQAVSPNKLAGWGWLVIYLIASLTLEKLGFTDPLYRYGRYPGWPLPAGLSGAASVAEFRVYWATAGIALTASAILLNGRGLDTPLLVRLRGLPARPNSWTGYVGLGALIGFVALGISLARRWSVP